jgi:hypothetical protein
MARQRTQKTISVRIDRAYIDRLRGGRRLRLALVFAAVAAAILFVALASFSGNSQAIHNPGRLTFAHAGFQNNCAACHDGCDQEGRPTGNFSLAVSDSACLKCHDAGVHHPNAATFVMMDTTRHPPELRSANCTACHVEHRGQDVLVTQSDLQCVQCHADLTGKTLKPAAPGVVMHVSAFSLADHPRFGRALMQNGVATDPTDLRFNHKKHLALLKGEQQNCTWCHNPAPMDVSSNAPQSLEDGTGRHRSLTQVNYDRNCKSCHDLGTFPSSDLPIPHEDLAHVRRVILSYITDSTAPWQKLYADRPGAREKALNDRILSSLGDNVPSDYSAVLDAVTTAVKSNPISADADLSVALAKLPPDVAARLAAAAIHLPTNIVPAADRARVRADVGATTQPVDHLRPLLIARLRTEAAKGLSGDAKTTVLRQFDAAFARFDQESPDPRLLQLYIVYANGLGSCIQCHDTSGDPGAVQPEWSALYSPKAITVAGGENIFRTAPTGIPAGPRRWYVNSEFDHDAHRSMNCLECHSAALNSEKTSDVLLPDIQWQGLKIVDGKLAPAQRSCVECHHPDDASGPGAASNCTECHTYHDRSHERPPASVSGSS